MNTAHAGRIYNLHNECLRVSLGVQAAYESETTQAWDAYTACEEAAEAAYRAEEERAWSVYKAATAGKWDARCVDGDEQAQAAYYAACEAAWLVRESAVLAAEHKRNAQLDAAWLAAASWESETP